LNFLQKLQNVQIQSLNDIKKTAAHGKNGGMSFQAEDFTRRMGEALERTDQLYDRNRIS
jgi:hypothetical protein